MRTNQKYAFSVSLLFSAVTNILTASWMWFSVSIVAYRQSPFTLFHVELHDILTWLPRLSFRSHRSWGPFGSVHARVTFWALFSFRTLIAFVTWSIGAICNFFFQVDSSHFWAWTSPVTISSLKCNYAFVNTNFLNSTKVCWLFFGITRFLFFIKTFHCSNQ